MPNGLVTVELDDGPDETPPAASEPRARRPRWPWAAAAGVVVVALAVGQHVGDARHDAHVARFDAVDGVLLPVPATPTKLRSWPDLSVLDAVEAGGRAVTSTLADGALVVRAIDRATAREVWTHSIAVPGRSADETPFAQCEPLTDAHGRTARVACTVAVHADDVSADQDDDLLATRITVLDGRTGQVVSQRDVHAWFWTTAGDLVVTATARTEAGKRTWTLDAVTSAGRPAWSRTLDPRDVLPPDDIGRLVEIGVHGDADQVVLTSDGLTTVLDPRGTVVRTLSGGRTTSWRPSRIGQLEKVVRTPVDDDPGAEIDVELADLPGVTATPLQPVVDDGTAPDVAFTTADDAGTAAYDVHDGHRLWAATRASSEAIVLGGRVYLLTAGGVEAHDARTGDVVWAHAAQEAGIHLLTDGRALYVADGASLAAFDLANGTSLGSRVVVHRDAPLVDDGSADEVRGAAGLLLDLHAALDGDGSVAALG